MQSKLALRPKNLSMSFPLISILYQGKIRLCVSLRPVWLVYYYYRFSIRNFSANLNANFHTMLRNKRKAYFSDFDEFNNKCFSFIKLRDDTFFKKKQ